MWYDMPSLTLEVGTEETDGTPPPSVFFFCGHPGTPYLRLQSCNIMVTHGSDGL